MAEVGDGWRLAVARMEAAARVGRLSLQALVGHCQVPLAALQVLASVAAEVASAQLSAAGVLNLLHRRYTDQGGSVQTRRYVHVPGFCLMHPYGLVSKGAGQAYSSALPNAFADG